MTIKLDRKTENRVVREYKKGATVAALTESEGVSRYIITGVLKRADVEIRPGGRPQTPVWRKAEVRRWAMRMKRGNGEVTLGSIAEEVGITRERVRQLMVEQGHQDAIDAGKAARRARWEQAEADRKAELDERARERRLSVRPATKKMRTAALKAQNESDIIEPIREWLEAGGDGTALSWDADRDFDTTVSSVRISQTMGWNAAVMKAGGTPTHINVAPRADRVSEEECLRAMVAFLTDPDETRGGYQAYDRWRHRQADPGAYPSGQTQRNRTVGGWSAAKQAALDHIASGEPLPEIPVPVPVSERPCSVESCDHVVARGGRLCSGHQARLRTHGDVLADIPFGDMPYRGGNRQSFSADDVIKALQSWEPRDGKYSVTEWCNNRSKDAPAYSVILRLFGGWRAALDAAGLS